MSECIVINPDGTVEFTRQPVEECTGYVLVSGAEHSFYALVQQLIEIPEPEVVMGWFSGACGTVLLFYFAAYGVGRIVSIFDRD